MLETRLLHFDRVLIVDATDDKLRARPPRTRCCPMPCCRVLGLPTPWARKGRRLYPLPPLRRGAGSTFFLAGGHHPLRTF